MKIKIWGARGSIPTPLKSGEIEEKICQAIFEMPDTVNTRDMTAIQGYVKGLPLLTRGTAGGNTSCVEIRAGTDIFIIDAGSGLRELGAALMEGPCGRGQGILHMFFSHAHWDHIQGFPFFMPAFVPGNQIFIYSLHDLKTALNNQQRSLNFPVPLSYMQANMKFVSLQAGHPFRVGQMQVNTIQNIHPGQSYSYRFEDQHSVFVYANDAEYKQLDEASLQAHLEFFKDADALVFDAQYGLKASWKTKVDWGHSSAWIGVDLARAARVKKLLLFHHDPASSDRQLQEIEAKALAYQAENTKRPLCEIIVAYEGLTLDLTPPGTVDLQIRSDGKAAILTPTSIFDQRGVDQLTQQLVNLAQQDSASSSIIDLSQVETLTTASLKALVTLHRDHEKSQIVLAAPSPNVQKIIELSDYSDLFAIYPSADVAYAALQARQALKLPGQVIRGRYKITSRVGKGRLGTTLKAIDTQSDTTVALKILSPTFSEETIDRFLQRTQHLISLNHPNIVHIFDQDKDEVFAFVVEEFVAGQTLQDILAKQERPIYPDQALDIALDLTLALEYAHSRGAIHSDLKPQNIFLTDQGTKISDFGLGRLEEGHNLLEAPLLFLTASYLAPEQIQGKPIDARTDLYALGVILYELFTGNLPFSGSEQAVLAAHVAHDKQPRPPRELNSAISVVLEHLILKLLAKDPNDRYTAVQQVRRILNSLLVNPGETIRQQRRTLVGREKQLAVLRRCWQEANAGQGQLAFISGEPGIGKTSLAQQVVDQGKGAILLVGHCRERVSSSPYYPFAEILRTYFALGFRQGINAKFKTNVALDKISPQLLANLSQLVPELGQIRPDLPVPPPLEPKQRQQHLITSLIQFIQQETKKQPWLLILDDLQWADQSSLAVLRYLSEHVSTLKLLIIGTYQAGNQEQNTRWQQTLSDSHLWETATHLPLDRLDEMAVDQILTNIWRQDAPKVITKMIYQHTAGNPFYIEEMARGLVDDNVITLQDGVWQFSKLELTHLTENVREAIWRRTRQLSPDTQKLLRRAAILGQVFRFDDLCQMIGLPAWQVLEHLDMALERQLIQEAPGEGLLCFSHPEIQHVLYEDLNTARRRLMHSRAGEIMERYAHPQSEQMATELAYHFGQAGEFQKALTYSLQAANQAKINYANKNALWWYQHALNMAQQVGDQQAERRCQAEITELVKGQG